ncbi:MAG: transglutaminase-like domain-containing protein [Thermodesulfobacteriota bacterium]
MYFKRMKTFWTGAALSGVLFLILFVLRLGFLEKNPADQFTIAISSESSLPEKDSWKNILQNGEKIGVSHSSLAKTPSGYLLQETLYLRINTMGMVQDISLNTTGKLHSDFSLAAFDFNISSGRFQFSAKGTVSDRVLTIVSQSSGSPRKDSIRLDQKLYLTTGIIDAVMASDLNESQVLTLFVFDPATMSQQPVDIRVIGREDIRIMGTSLSARKVSLSFKGATQLAWVGESGEILKEQGLLGISLEKTTRTDALFGLPVGSSQDLTQVASVSVNIPIENPESLDRLRIKIDGIQSSEVSLDGGRQTFRQNILTVVRESLPGLSAGPAEKGVNETLAEFLKPSLFIQSNDPKIKKLADSIVSADDPALIKARKLVDWINRNIEKRPVLSLPDALSTLENQVGDCNEHAMLLSALARAAGIPAKIEAGLVYLNGRFYYHAWNLLYLGEWITVDALFGQVPADVTHIRFSSGAQSLPLDIMGIIGNVKLEILPL